MSNPIKKQRGRPRKKEITVGSTWNGWLILAPLDDMWKCQRVVCGHISRRSDYQLRARAQKPCPECFRISDEKKLIGTRVGTFVVTGFTGERNDVGRSILTIECSLCGGTREIDREKLAQNRQRGNAPICRNCVGLEFAAAVAEPLVLTEDQGSRALASARKAIFKVLPFAKATEHADEIVSEVIVALLSKGKRVIPDDIGALSYAIARRFALRIYNPGPNFIDPRPTDEDGYHDVFDHVILEPTDSHENDELQVVALSTLSPEDRSWVYEYMKSNKSGATKNNKAKYAEMIERVRTAYGAILSRLERDAVDAC
jgi:hypothetical protein